MPIRSLRKRQRGKPVIYCFSFSGASHCQTPEQRDTSHKPRGVSRFFRALKAKTRRLKLRIPSGTTSWAELITPALHPGPRTATNPKSDPASHSQTQLQPPPGNIPISCSPKFLQTRDTSRFCSHQESSGCCWWIWENVSRNFCS